MQPKRRIVPIPDNSPATKAQAAAAAAEGVKTELDDESDSDDEELMKEFGIETGNPASAQKLSKKELAAAKQQQARVEAAKQKQRGGRGAGVFATLLWSAYTCAPLCRARYAEHAGAADELPCIHCMRSCSGARERVRFRPFIAAALL